MENHIKLAIEAIEPSYDTNSSYHYPIPNEITLSIYSGRCSIDINLKGELLSVEVFNEDVWVDMTEQDIEYLYKYTNGLLEEEIELTKRYYEEERYEEQKTYFIR